MALDQPSKALNLLLILCGIFVLIAGRWVPDVDLDAMYQPGWIERLHTLLTRISVMTLGGVIILNELFKPKFIVKTFPFMSYWLGNAIVFFLAAGFVIQPNDNFGLVAGVVIVAMALSMCLLQAFSFDKPPPVFPSAHSASDAEDPLVVTDDDGVEYFIGQPVAPPGVLDIPDRTVSFALIGAAAAYALPSLLHAIFYDYGAFHKTVVHIYVCAFGIIVALHEMAAPPLISYWLPFLSDWAGLGASYAICGLLLMTSSSLLFFFGSLIMLFGIALIINRSLNLVRRPPPVFPSMTDALPGFCVQVPLRGGARHAAGHTEYDDVDTV